MNELEAKKMMGVDLTEIGKKYSKFLGNEETLKNFLHFTICMSFTFFENEKEAENFLIKNSIMPIQFMKNMIGENNE